LRRLLVAPRIIALAHPEQTVLEFPQAVAGLGSLLEL